MAILYAIIARPSNGKGTDRATILCEYSKTTGNFKQITATILGKITSAERKASLTYDSTITFHLICEDQVLYMAMCDSAQARVPFAFLESIKTNFRERYTKQAIESAISYSFESAMAGFLSEKMAFYNSGQADAFGNVEGKINEVKNVMVQNIDSILARGEKLDMLVDRTQELQESSKQFRNQSRQLRSAMFWKKMRLYIGVFFALVLGIWLLTSFICGFDYSKCSDDDDKK